MEYSDRDIDSHKDSHPHLGAKTNGEIRKAAARLEGAAGAGAEQARQALAVERWLRGLS